MSEMDYGDGPPDGAVPGTLVLLPTLGGRRLGGVIS